MTENNINFNVSIIFTIVLDIFNITNLLFYTNRKCGLCLNWQNIKMQSTNSLTQLRFNIYPPFSGCQI